MVSCAICSGRTRWKTSVQKRLMRALYIIMFEGARSSLRESSRNEANKQELTLLVFLLLTRYQAACQFLERNNLLSIIRAHEAQDAG